MVCIAGPLALYTFTGERMRFTDQGDIVLVRYWPGGDQVIGRLDGYVGIWWITYPNGTSELWDWEKWSGITPKVVDKVSPKAAGK